MLQNFQINTRALNFNENIFTDENIVNMSNNDTVFYVK